MRPWTCLTAALLLAGCPAAEPPAEKPAMTEAKTVAPDAWPAPTPAEQKAARAGDATQQYRLARHLATQPGHSFTEGEVRDLLAAAAKAGHGPAMALLGAYEADLPDPARSAAGVALVEAAAAKQDPDGEFQLAVWRTSGLHGPKDADAARALYQRAHQHGHPDALEYGRVRLDAGPLEKVWQWLNAT